MARSLKRGNMKPIEISAMTQATSIEDGDLFVLQRTISGTDVPLSVPAALLLVAGQDMSGQTVNWTDSSGTAQSTTLAEIAQKLAFFTISDGCLCINRGMLNATPTQDGELYDNGALMGINYAE